MTEAFVYDAIRTPRGRGKKTGSLHESKPISLVIGLCSDGAWAIVSGTARVWLARSPRRLELIGGAGGLVLVGLGVRLAVTGRKD